MIISKINSIADSEKTEILFNVRQTNSECELYGTMDFTEQKVLSSFVVRNDVMIADTIESISEESVKMLDKLAMIPVKIL